MTLQYNAPPGDKSTVDGHNSNQMNSFFWLRKSLIEARKEQYFTPLADVTKMPQHYGKEIKVYEYVPLLDDRNVNDQGIDANGVVADPTKFSVQLPSLVMEFAIETDATAAESAINAVEAGVATKSGSATPWTVTATKLRLNASTDVLTAAVLAAVPGSSRSQQGGNLYGSSKDIGTITSKLPVLGENGGRVNRVGFTRLSRTGALTKYGFFYEFTNESLVFDSDPQLKDHLSRELMNGAVQVYEAVLQTDLLTNAQTVVYSGAATSDATITGDTSTTPGATPPSVVSYDDFTRLDKLLTAARTPKQTKIITGSRNIDTKVIPASRVMYVGPDVSPMLKRMKDPFDNQAFIGVQHYAAAGTVLEGEIGTIDGNRIIEVPEMQYWAGAGAEETAADNPGYQVTMMEDGKNHYNVYPMLVVGDQSFTTVGFQTNGKTGKFTVITKMPGIETANLDHDPYGEKGFSSIKWYYGTLVFRPERLGMIKTVAPV